MTCTVQRRRCGLVVRTAVETVLVYSECIAAYIQGLYNTVLVLGGSRCVRQRSEIRLQSAPPPSSDVGLEEKRSRSNLVGGVRCCCRYCVCRGDEDATSTGRTKTSTQGGRKTVTGPSPGGTPAEGGETNGSEKETPLVGAGPPGRVVAGLAAMFFGA